MPGIFVLKGMQLRVTNLSFKIDDNGNVESDLRLNLSYDACAAWARIALTHRQRAIEAKKHRVVAWQDADGDQRGALLEAEFEASMQAIVGSASAIDALYAQVAERYPVSNEISEAWRKNRTARPTQVLETMRCAFGIRQNDIPKLKDYLRGLYRLRDAALHPTGTHQPPHHHPELDAGVEWRFWSFRADVADNLTCTMAQILHIIATSNGKKPIHSSQFKEDFKKMVLDLLPSGPPEPASREVSFWLPGQGKHHPQDAPPL